MSDSAVVSVKEKPPAAAAPLPFPTVAQDMRTVDIEKLSRNIAMMVEEGGKALAAYLKPRQEGEVKIEPAAELAEVVKTLGQVAEYWLSDPQRSVELHLVDRETGKTSLRDQRPFTFQPGESQTIDFWLRGLASGVHQGFLKLVGEDALACDDVLEAPANSTV